MSSFLGISIWITLATVVPGLITMAVLYWSIVVVNNEWLPILRQPLVNASDWIWAGLGMFMMVMTQTFGILLAELLVCNKWLGPEKIEVEIPEGIDPHGETKIIIEPYFEYQGLYILLSVSQLTNSEPHVSHSLRHKAQSLIFHLEKI